MKKTNPKKAKTKAHKTVEELSKTNDLTSTKGVLELMVERGAKAWKDVPDASAWVEELRGNDAS
jgi:hypothetical protein